MIFWFRRFLQILVCPGWQLLNGVHPTSGAGRNLLGIGNRFGEDFVNVRLVHEGEGGAGNGAANIHGNLPCGDPHDDSGEVFDLETVEGRIRNLLLGFPRCKLVWHEFLHLLDIVLLLLEIKAALLGDGLNRLGPDVVINLVCLGIGNLVTRLDCWRGDDDFDLIEDIDG